MQDLAVTPLCAIKGDMVNKHKRYFSNMVDCPKCHHIKEVCTCKKDSKIVRPVVEDEDK